MRVEVERESLEELAKWFQAEDEGKAKKKRKYGEKVGYDGKNRYKIKPKKGVDIDALKRAAKDWL
jgi:hypothetical protein